MCRHTSYEQLQYGCTRLHVQLTAAGRLTRPHLNLRVMAMLLPVEPVSMPSSSKGCIPLMLPQLSYSCQAWSCIMEGPGRQEKIPEGLGRPEHSRDLTP